MCLLWMLKFLHICCCCFFPVPKSQIQLLDFLFLSFCRIMSQLCTQLYLSERLILVATQVHNIMYALSWSLIYTDAVCGLEDYGNESVLFKIRPNRILDYAQASMPILSRLSCIYVCVCVHVSFLQCCRRICFFWRDAITGCHVFPQQPAQLHY